MNKQQMSETLLLGTILALAGGFLDAYTYLTRGGVFANAQTGNMVLMGVYAAQGNWSGCIRYLIPVLAFVCGVIIAEIIKGYFKGNQSIHWRQIVVAIEAAALLAVANLPSGAGDVAANVLVSFVCSMQVQAFRKMNGSVYATTMCTGNLRSAIEQIWIYRKNRENINLKRSISYLIIIGSFIVGAVVGCIASQTLKTHAVYIAAALLFVGLILMKKSPDEQLRKET